MLQLFQPGRPGGTWTPNLRFWRPLLCQLSYWPCCAHYWTYNIYRNCEIIAYQKRLFLRSPQPGSNRWPLPYQGSALPLSHVGLQTYLGAGDGNRTHAISLEGWGSTIELHPPMTPICRPSPTQVLITSDPVGGGGRIRTFEGVSRQIYSLLPLAAWVPLRENEPRILISGERGVNASWRVNC